MTCTASCQYRASEPAMLRQNMGFEKNFYYGRKSMKHTMLHMKLNSAVSVFAVAAAFSVLLPPSALAGICFLPDCGDDEPILIEPINVKYCEENGYVSSCPENTAKIPDSECYRDTNYFKCSKSQWCKENGYNITSCSVPQYLSEQCPNGEALYKSCQTDNARACKELGYTNTCPSEQKLKNTSGRCSYDSSYGTCCTPSGCPSYTSLTSSSYGTNGTDGCEYTCYYTCNMNCPDGTSTSNPGGCGGSTRNGCNTKTCYYPYVSCCSETCPSSHPYSNCDYGYTSVTENECGTKKCYACRPEPEPVVKKYCSGNMMYEDYNYGGSFIGVIVDGLIVRKDVRYLALGTCKSSCYNSTVGNRSWRIPNYSELKKMSCAISALGGAIDDTYWYTAASITGMWLFSDYSISDPENPMYKDQSNYCACVADV